MSIKNALIGIDEGIFTTHAKNKSSDMIEKFRPKEGMIQFFTNNTIEEIVKYLNDNRLTMSFGLALKRIIRKKYNLGDNVDDSVLIDELYNAFHKHNIPLVERNDKGRNMTSIEKGRIKQWLNKDSGDRKIFLSKISFALEMNITEVAEFLTKVLAEQYYNIRNIEEVILFYCHYRALPYSKYLELHKSLTAENPKETVSRENINNDFTNFFEKNYESIFSDETSLQNFIIENKDNFTQIRKSAIIKFCELYDEICLLIKKYELQTGITDRWVIDSDYDIKGSKFDKEIIKKPLKRERIWKLKNGKENVTKKDLVTLCFYKFCIKRDMFFEKNGSEAKISYQSEALKFIDEVNFILYENGFFELYEGYRFDNLVILSLYNSEPWSFFDDVIEGSFFYKPEFD